MLSTFARFAVSSILASLVTTASYATCGGGGGGGVGGMQPPTAIEPQAYVVPWRTFGAGEPPAGSSLVLYWLPVSKAESRRSDLLVSRPLTLYSAQCIALEMVPFDDEATATRLGATGKLPLAILTTRAGKEIARAGGEGKLQLAAVEKMVASQIRSLESEADKVLDSAYSRAEADDKAKATELFRQVWDERCLFPAKAKEAKRELEKLGVTVKDAGFHTAGPDRSAATGARIARVMAAGLKSELAGDYLKARALYLSASAIDRHDPVPLRFLGELDRHHTGNWESAKKTFRRLLAMQADPLSKAVALHGLGKITIHEGDSSGGLALFERSIDSYPLALTYRNLAVYWNSEGKLQKADEYVKRALALEPAEPYNLIFAATYLVDSGKAEEARQIARENEGMLAASYNLAAIYAMLGEKGKAMELLHRHFYEFERFDAVRAREMWEARVDVVFASMKNDPGFVSLTALAK